MHTVTWDSRVDEALEGIGREKAGFLPPFLSQDELAELLEAWYHVFGLPYVQVSNKRFVVDHRLYEEPAFARLATHPVVQEAARRVLGDFQLAGYAMVATPRNGEEATTAQTVNFHVDHCVYSDVPVAKARDTFVCIWVNFEELAMENGPFALAVGTDKLNLGWEHFQGPGNSKAVRDMGWSSIAGFNIGPAGSTAVYSGKTWHAGTVNCSDSIRKGLNINIVPAHPLDTLKRNPFDLCALSRERYAKLDLLIDRPGYLIDHDERLAKQARDNGFDWA